MSTVKVGQAFTVRVAILSGWATQLRAFLDDGMTVATLAADNGGIDTQTAIEFHPVARTAGTWRLRADGQNCRGQSAGTGLVRLVTVTP